MKIWCDTLVLMKMCHIYDPTIANLALNIADPRLSVAQTSSSIFVTMPESTYSIFYVRIGAWLFFTQTVIFTVHIAFVIFFFAKPICIHPLDHPWAAPFTDSIQATKLRANKQHSYPLLARRSSFLLSACPSLISSLTSTAIKWILFRWSCIIVGTAILFHHSPSQPVSTLRT